MRTGESSWERPAGLVWQGVPAASLGRDAAAGAGVAPEAAAAIAADAAALAGEWEVVDDGAGSVYYYNVRTGLSQWDLPAGL